MKVNELVDLLRLEVLNLSDGEREIHGGYTGDLLSWVMSRAEADNVWVTIMTNINVVAVAQLTDVACVIIAEDAEVTKEVVARAEAQGINLFRSVRTSWELIGAIADKV